MHLIVEQYGSFIGKKSERIRVTVKKEVVAEVPVMNLDHLLVIAGGVSISSDAIYKCAEAGVPISFLSRSGKPYARVLSPQLTGTIKTRREQLLAYNDRRGLTLGIAFARGKLLNQANLLKYMAKYRKRKDMELYRQVRYIATEIEVLADELRRLQGESVESVRPQLLNLEGRGAGMYWEAVDKLLLADVEWEGRKRRGAQDLVNSLLNYGYGILYTQVEGAIILAGLDPYAGFVHVDRPGKPSLVLDLVEEFRQMVVDRVVFGLLNRGLELSVEDGWLTDSSRKLLAEKVLERLEGREPYEGKKRKLRTIIQSQARHIATFLRGERKQYRPFVGRW